MRFNVGDRVLVRGLLRTEHTGTVRNTCDPHAGQDYTTVDIDLPSGETVAHQFFLDDDRLSPLS
jgi:hypothetical protein